MPFSELIALIRHVVFGVVSVASLSVAGYAQAQSVANGQAMYATDCAGCHGGANPAVGTKRVQLGTSAAVLRNAINSFPAMSGIALNDTQLADVAAFIAASSSTAAGSATTSSAAVVSPITQGKGMYNAMCISCHGDVSVGQGYSDIYDARSGASILRAIARKRAMQHLNFVTIDQADLIAAYIANPRGASAHGGAGVGSGSMASADGAGGEGRDAASRYGNSLPMGGCTLGRLDQPTDPLWALMLIGAVVALIRRRNS